MQREEIRLAAIFAGWGSLLFFFSFLLQTFVLQADSIWVMNLFANLLGYATILFPGYLGLRYVRESGYLDRGTGRFAAIVRLFFKGKEDTVEDDLLIKADKPEKKETTMMQDFIEFMWCALGLQVSYLVWGLLQEKIMTREYEDSAGNTKKYTDAQFLVFVNRILAFAVALTAIMLRRQPRHKAPLFKYSYCSFSNIMSSWCQYEALKYVSFPTQVLAKATKIIPVMLMGKLVSNKTYERYEYLVAVLISLGMMAFLFGKDGSSDKADQSTTVSGLVILVGYMAFDAFTSNWQSALFKDYSMSSIQMMAGVNLFSCALTSVSLIQQGVFISALTFMSQFPRFVTDCIILSLCSAVGQLFIYHTIDRFGAVIFVIIMTVRQVLAVILSTLVYQHAMSATSLVGVLIIFAALFLKSYCGYRLKQQKKKAAAAPPAKA